MVKYVSDQEHPLNRIRMLRDEGYSIMEVVKYLNIEFFKDYRPEDRRRKPNALDGAALYVNVFDLADNLRISSKAIYRMLKNGAIPFVQIRNKKMISRSIALTIKKMVDQGRIDDFMTGRHVKLKAQTDPENASLVGIAATLCKWVAGNLCDEDRAACAGAMMGEPSVGPNFDRRPNDGARAVAPPTRPRKPVTPQRREERLREMRKSPKRRAEASLFRALGQSGDAPE